jgi:prolyl-tRNA synthetase
MRRSQYFCSTLREDPSAGDVAGHLLLLRGSFIQPLAAGIYSFLPLGERVKRKVEVILREEMEAVGAQEVSLPVVHPADLWKESGRWDLIGPELARFRDRGDRDMVLAMTHEEIVADLVRKQVRSYRQLPAVLYQIQTKFRDEPRSRGGLIRAREFVMKDAYSCHVSFEDLDEFYPRMHQAYLNIFQRAGLDVISVEADVGMMGGTMAHEFMYLSEIGEDQLVLCDACGYAANRQVATFTKMAGEQDPIAELQEVATPSMTTIASLAQYLNVPESRTAKAAFFMADERLIFAVVRGDMEVSETKLANAVGALELRPATPGDLEETGIVPGYASPIGVNGAVVVVDDLVAELANLVAGANRRGYHLLNTNYARDYTADVVTDIAAAYPDAPCVRCGAALRLVRGVEVGNIFKLGTKYSDALGCTFLDESGRAQPVVMGSYGIGLGRLIGCVAQQGRDDRGLIWPISLAPFEVNLVGLDLDDEVVRTACDAFYANLLRRGVEVLYDDRSERAGVKFNDADLLGMPLRVTISRRTVAHGTAEIKPRSEAHSDQVALEEAVDDVVHRLEALRWAGAQRARSNSVQA